ncbi:beta-L-arabinofuranosidase domain-containing protein [Niabella hirudinis]|uniref:beta-L-arabinofuranosidase domain-containing protein n=1 Tax=Niabella hirudinis TaxID=1285929 RepID=UPI003EBE5EAA
MKIFWLYKRFLILIPLLLSVGGVQGQVRQASFPLSAVQLSESFFKAAQQTDLNYILSLEPDRLLAPFLKEAGLKPRAKNYGNWESSGLDGHIGGHYLSALSNMFAATKDTGIWRRLNYMIDELERCQQQHGNGYLGGIPGGDTLWKDIAAGKITAGSFSLNGKWVPWYNLHKLFSGLIDAYRIAGIAKAKPMLAALSGWCLQLVSGLSDAQIQRMLQCEHGGMNEALADAAAITGDDRYLQLAKRFSHQLILEPLLRHRDMLTGMHANTQIPKVIGFMRIATLTGNSDWADAADFFWQTVVKNRSVSFGGNSVREHFNPVDDFSSMLESREGPETCNSYNMLKLSKQLFLQHPSAAYMDYYERTVYNHILSSQNPAGGFVYFTPIRPGHYRVYSKAQEDFWCCVGSGLENHGKYGEMIYTHRGADLYVNLFIPSVLNWQEKGLRLIQETRFPYEAATHIKLETGRPQRFRLYLRKPHWVRESGLQLLVNGRLQQVAADSNSYVSIDRVWERGDVVTVQLPMHTEAEQLPDHSPWVSFTHGPIVLAAAIDTADSIGFYADGSRSGHIAKGPLRPLQDAPVFVAPASALRQAIAPVKGQQMQFKISGTVYPNRYRDLRLVPFYTLHNTRYVLYWPFTTREGLLQKQKEVSIREAARARLEQNTIDQVQPGEQQPETDHGFKGQATASGIHNERHWRDATGWFSYELRNEKKEARKLRVTYWGADKGRRFQIRVNGLLLATVVLDGTAGDRFIEVDYHLPASVNTGQPPVLTVKFEADPGSVAGGVFEVRLMK